MASTLVTPYQDHNDDLAASFNPPNDSTRSSIDTTSTTSLILERINHPSALPPRYDDPDEKHDGVISDDDDEDLEAGHRKHPNASDNRKEMRKIAYIVGGTLIGSWLIALVIYLSHQAYKYQAAPHDPAATSLIKPGKTITMDQVQGGQWRARRKGIEWIGGEKDGLMLVPYGQRGYLEVHDVKDKSSITVLMKERSIEVGGLKIAVTKYWPSTDLKKVLCASDVQSHWRHSFSARYWILDVDTQKAEPLIPGDPHARLSLAVWAPTSDAVAYVISNNVRVRELSDDKDTIGVTTDGGTSLFYGIPDWVYEEEVFSGAQAMWWSEDGKHLAFLRTNETEVPEYPLQYFVSRPSGEYPPPALENYPELDWIKYPKAGAPNPVVDLQFFDLNKKEVFSVNIKDDFPDDDRLITEVVWAGAEQVLIRESNRESDLLRMILIDVTTRSGKVTREVNVAELDGGWFEVSQSTKYIPAAPDAGREEAGYIDTVIHEGYDHLAYFTPLDAEKPILLTQGKWEVVDAPSGIDLKNNIVYFVSTERSSVERHVYSVKLDGTDKQSLTNTSVDGRYDVSFSNGGGYALLSYNGPGIPWQKVIGTPAVDSSFSQFLEENHELADMASKHELPTFHFSTVKVDGFDLNVVERRPPHFDPKKKYPVIFHVYGGPGSQTVSKAFNIDFQAYLAAGLEYLVVSVDGRGTGFIGRAARCAVRGNLGYWEAHDQIATAKIWAAKPYVDSSRIGIWGWSYGGFMTLKTLEQDGGQTFSYGMAVAPVTDWRFYDSIYTERYMHTPMHNPGGYENATVTNTTALAENVRFLLMHGVADDNVHFQNSLTLLDKLDLAGVENYDVHVFPDSDHSIYFHNANRMVYDRLRLWLIRAFNGEYLKLEDLKPVKNFVPPEGA
ncbi:putative dipeptidyl-aminopeptidase B [Sphaerosporella brunnea]|uniref:dipeptidyl-peptidase IV n=1 Tax=Sphaerosporella brunnea TaxID=1250544 RepID=A0A5J5EZA3_9PEZI|nr:putative dipeptidyl-aminopeptidase B [Sphaerosporella brunnea]